MRLGQFDMAISINCRPINVSHGCLCHVLRQFNFYLTDCIHVKRVIERVFRCVASECGLQLFQMIRAYKYTYLCADSCVSLLQFQVR